MIKFNIKDRSVTFKGVKGVLLGGVLVYTIGNNIRNLPTSILTTLAVGGLGALAIAGEMAYDRKRDDADD